MQGGYGGGGGGGGGGGYGGPMGGPMGGMGGANRQLYISNVCPPPWLINNHIPLV